MLRRLSLLVLTVVLTILLIACGGEARSTADAPGGAQKNTLTPSPTDTPDTTPPASAVSLRDAAKEWYRSPQKLAILVTDDSSPDDACIVYYSVDGKKTWKQGRSVTVKGQGKRVIWTYAVDATGNEEAPHAQEIYLDNTPPVTVALSSPTVAQGKTTTIKYRVNDASPAATVSIRLTGPARRTFSVGEESCNQASSYPLTANLPAGTYTYTVNAKDTAGNVAVRKGSGRITVVPLSVAYKSRCKRISFKVLNRNANQLVGRKYVLRGQVFQIQDAGPDQYWTEFEEFAIQPRTQILLSITSLGYGVYTDEVAAVFEGDMKRVYEDDIITIWGECLGSYSYESVAGWTITVPLIHIKYFAK